MRFTCSSSTSTWAKSVLSVRSSTKPGINSDFTSSPSSASCFMGVSPLSSSSCLVPPKTNGLTSTLIP